MTIIFCVTGIHINLSMALTGQRDLAARTTVVNSKIENRKGKARNRS